MGRTWDDVSIDDASIEDIDRESIEYFLRKGIEAQRIPESLVSASTEEILTSFQESAPICASEPIKWLLQNISRFRLMNLFHGFIR